MFNFTTTTVINSDKDITTKKPLWQVITPTDDSKPTLFQVLRVNNFAAPNVTAIFEADPVEAEMAKIGVDLSTLEDKVKELPNHEDGPKTGEVYRLALYIGLTQASQDSRYANDLVYKGKPFTIDFVWLDSAENTAAKIVKDIQKLELDIYGNKILNYSVDGSVVYVEATNGYQRIKGLSVDMFMPLAYHFMGDYLPLITLADFTEADKNEDVSSMTWFKGKEEFCTAAYILHNLRLPSIENERAFSPNKPEMPVPGALYTQFTIHYCVKRGELGMNAVGHLVQSHTTHVFFVRDAYVEDFKSKLLEFAEAAGLDGIEVVPAE